jgi:Secretion system C-terminal sorting domain
MKTTQTNIVSAFILAAILMVNTTSAQGNTNNDTTSTLPVIPFSMTVVFVEFDIVAKPQGNQINWSIILEANLAKYEIQRITSNQTFETIGTVHGKGSNAVTVKYSFTDTHPVAGNNVYRLKMVDSKNGFKYSSTKIVNSVMQVKESVGFTAYPNPARPGASIKLDVNQPGQYEVRMHDLSGKKVYSDRVVSGQHATLNIQVPNALSAGIYIIKLTGQGNLNHFQQKIVLQ